MIHMSQKIPLEMSDEKDAKILMTISYPDTRLKKEMETLQKNGYKIEVVMWERGWPFPWDGKDENVSIKSLKINTPAGDIRSILYFPIWWIFLLFWLFKTEWESVHAVNFDTYLFSLFVAKIKNKPIIYDIYDFYGDVMPSFLRNIVIRLDRYLIPLSNILILADDSRVDQIGGKIHNNIFTINNSPIGSYFTKKFNYSCKGGNNHFTVFIGGKIAEQRCLDMIISTVGEMKDIRLIVRGHCGETDYKQRIIQLGKKFDNIDLYLDGVPYEEIVDGTMNADLTIALYDPRIPNNKYASPNKLFEAMAAGIPIIVNDDTSMAGIVRNENCGIVIPYKNADALKKALKSLKENNEFQIELSSNGRKAYENRYNWTIMEERLMNIYDQVLNTC